VPKDFTSTGVSWEMLGIIGAIVVAMLAGATVVVGVAYVLGAQGRQIETNTGRLESLKTFREHVIEYEATLSAEEKYNQQRIDKLENTQNAHQR
jgi:hypothetical protein